MPFEKGKSGNQKGRPKGTQNLVTRDLRSMIQTFLENKFPQIMENFDTIEPRHQIELWIKLAEYVLPKMKHIDQDIEKVLYSVKGLPDKMKHTDGKNNS